MKVQRAEFFPEEALRRGPKVRKLPGLAEADALREKECSVSLALFSRGFFV